MTDSGSSLAPFEGHRYQILGPLGSGGMGEVFKARDRKLNRMVALKFLRATGPRETERLLLEARFQASLSHPSIGQVYDVGEVEGHATIAMQLIEGPGLDELAPQLSPAEAGTILAAVARAVHEAHRQGLVHRDLKPGNVLLEKREGGWHPFVMDFGLARLEDGGSMTQGASGLGTPHYMAPEQITGEGPLDLRCDIYGLGATLYALLAGEPPFQHSGLAPGPIPAEGGTAHAVETLRRILDEEPRPLRSLRPELPRDLATIVHTCLEKDPNRRYPTALALAEDLERFLGGRPILARAPSLWDRGLKALRRNRRLALAVGAGLVLATLGAAWGLRALRLARRQTDLARRYGQSMEQVTHRLRLAHLAPLHDRRAQVAWVRGRMAEIRREMARLGPWAEGPSAFALGQGHLALDEPEEAREALQRAWAAGLRDPEVARALGQAFVQLYDQGKRALKEIFDPAQRAKRLKELEEGPRAEALKWLQLAGQEPDGASLSRAQLARLDGRIEEALRELEVATAATPWAYEAWALRYQILENQALAREEAGDRAEALRLEGEAEGAMDRAVEIGRSDPGLWTRRAEALTNRAMEEEQDRHGDPMPWLVRALEACDRASAADPSLPAPIVHRSRIQWDQGNHHSMRRQHAEAYRRFDGAVADAERALALGGRTGPALNRLGLALTSRAEEAQDLGLPTHPDLIRAAEILTKAISQEPRHLAHRLNLAYVHYALAGEAQRNGGDPVPHFRAGVQVLREGLALEPAQRNFLGSLGATLMELSRIQIRRGQDPSGDLADAAEAFTQLLQARPAFAPALRDLGAVRRLQAIQELRAGRDPSPRLAEARPLTEKAFALAPHQAKMRLEACELELTEAQIPSLPLSEALAKLDLARRRARSFLAAHPQESDFKDLLKAANALERELRKQQL